MIIVDTIDLFVKVSDELSEFSRTEIKKLLDLERYKDKEAKQSLEEYLTLIILYKFSQVKTAKAFWYSQKFFSLNCWPNMPSYHRFIVWINRLAKILKVILDKYLVKLQSQLGYLDSTKLETSKPYWFGKVHKKSKKGHSSTGEFRGFKLHTLINTKWLICSHEITSGNVHDLTPVKEGLLNNNTGKILADSGYVGKETYYDLMAKNIHFIAKPRASMMENNSLGLSYLPDWKEFKELYKKRVNIERFFNDLKENLNLKINKLHSEKGFLSNVYSCLLASQWKNSKYFEFTKI